VLTETETDSARRPFVRQTPDEHRLDSQSIAAFAGDELLDEGLPEILQNATGGEF
jgi:hypothetical protein